MHTGALAFPGNIPKESLGCFNVLDDGGTMLRAKERLWSKRSLAGGNTEPACGAGGAPANTGTPGREKVGWRWVGAVLDWQGLFGGGQSIRGGIT